jgi:hypothetical protein
MKLIQKILLVAVLIMLLSAPAYAMSDLRPVFHNLFMGLLKAIGIYCFPFVFGWLITKKGRRSWFTVVSGTAYSISALAFLLMSASFFSHSSPVIINTLFVAFFVSPLLLLPIAIYTHWQKAPSIEVVKVETSVEF